MAPRGVRRRAEELVRLDGGVRDWEARVGFALEDAFAGLAARATFQSSLRGPGGIEYLRSLRDSVSQFPISGERAPYWSERRASALTSSDTFEKLTCSFVRLIEDLYGRGWLEQAAAKGCVDGDDGVDPGDLLEGQVRDLAFRVRPKEPDPLELSRS